MCSRPGPSFHLRPCPHLAGHEADEHPSIQSLEAAGLVERRARNQRVVLVRLTKRGRECLETATRRVRVAERAALADLSREDERTVQAWLANVAAMTTSPKNGGVKRQERS